MHPCYFCRDNETEAALCGFCVEDLTFLGVGALPPPEATREDVKAWALAHEVSFFACGPEEIWP